jgi:hypothetical protein
VYIMCSETVVYSFMYLFLKVKVCEKPFRFYTLSEITTGIDILIISCPHIFLNRPHISKILNVATGVAVPNTTGKEKCFGRSFKNI